MRNRVAFLGAKTLETKIVDENGVLDGSEVELLFLGADGLKISETLPIMGISKHFIITKEGVIKRCKEKPFGVEQDENFLSFQEFLDFLEEKCDG